MFEESLSAGMEDDVVVVPNIPMLVSKAYILTKVTCSTTNNPFAVYYYVS